MKKRAILLTLILEAAGLGYSFAGTGWFVTVHNGSEHTINIQFAGNDGWHCNDFCLVKEVEAKSAKTFYTEEQYQNFTPGIQGIDINTANVKSNAHVEFWTAVSNFGNWNEHDHSQNLKVKNATNGGSKVEFLGIDNINCRTSLLVDTENGSFGTVYADLYIPPIN